MRHQLVGGGEPLSPRGSVALLVDGDNMAADKAGQVLLTAAGLGGVIIKRVYAAAAHLKDWEKSHGFSLRYAQRAKNATDLLLTIEAVELAHRGDLKNFVLVSSDRDFAPLARWLVEKGNYVLGLGGPLAPMDWRKSCSRFEIIETPRERPAVPTATQSAATTGPIRVSASQGGVGPQPVVLAVKADRLLSPTDLTIKDVIAAEGQANSIEIGRLGASMSSRRKVTLGSLGVTSWRSYLVSKPSLYQLEPKGPTARVKWIGPQ